MSALPNTLPQMCDAEHNPPRSFVRRRGRTGGCEGFSLVEAVLALGVVAFAFIPILGLLPIGMTTFRKAMDVSVSTLINQRIVDEAQQTDFSAYIAKAPVTRYFNDEGEELTATNGQTPPGAIYQVNTRIANSPFLPGSRNANENLSTITVQIASNPGNVCLTKDANNLWVTDSKSAVPVVTYSTVVAGNNTSSVN